jgi:hypothetical protein
MVTRISRVLTLVLICANAPIYAQTVSNDPLTGIPVFPSAAGGDENYPAGICRVKAQTAVYTVKISLGSESHRGTSADPGPGRGAAVSGPS